MKIFRTVFILMLIGLCFGPWTTHAKFAPMMQIINKIGDWGKANGNKILQAYDHMGDWQSWAEVDLGIFFRDFENVTVFHDSSVGPGGKTVDLLLEIEGGKDIAVGIICEIRPEGPNTAGDAQAYKKVIEMYDRMKSLDRSKYRPIAMGIMVSDIANRNAQYNLCDKSLFDQLPLYRDKAGSQINLYFRWI